MKADSIRILQKLCDAYPEPIRKSELAHTPNASKAISRLLLNDPPMIRVTGLKKLDKLNGQLSVEPCYKLTSYGLAIIHHWNQEHSV